MATYDFTNSWDIGSYIKDGNTNVFTQLDYESALLYAEAQGYAPTGGNLHTSDLKQSFGSTGFGGMLGDGVDLLNFVDFDYQNDGSSDWTAMNAILGDDNTVGAFATAIKAVKDKYPKP